MACDCIITPISSQIKASKYVVTGRVIFLLDTDKEKQNYLSSTNKAYRITLKITKAYKGNLQKNQTIEISSEFTNCDILFIKKERYLLFLCLIDNKYFVNQCSSSDIKKKALKSIREIKRLTQ